MVSWLKIKDRLMLKNLMLQGLRNYCMNHFSPVGKKLATALLSTTLLIPGLSSAANITNGDFSGGFDSWERDVDGFTPSAGFNDFTIVQPTTGNNAARIEADYWSTPGDTFSTANDEVFFAANTLYQGLDLSASAGQELVLSFDWVFSGEGSVDEFFLVALGFDYGTGAIDYHDETGNIGYLLEQTTYGSGTYSTILDSSFANATGWTLDFQMVLDGYNGFGSNAVIDNVSLSAVTNTSNNVPEPAVIWLMGLGLLGLAKVQRKTKTV